MKKKVLIVDDYIESVLNLFKSTFRVNPNSLTNAMKNCEGLNESNDKHKLLENVEFTIPETPEGLVISTDFYSGRSRRANRLNADSVVELAQKNKYDLVFLDVNFSIEMFGLKILEKLNSNIKLLPIIMLTSIRNYAETKKKGKKVSKNVSEEERDKLEEDIKVLEEAMRLGAADYIGKETNPENFKAMIINYLTKNPAIIWGDSDVIRDLRKQIARYSQYNLIKIFIQGDTGTGKEIVANYIHKLSRKRHNHNFVAMQCNAIPEGLFESTLFGHKKGAFTGATVDRIGQLRLADKGTFFMDEVNSLPIEFQAKLLRALESREFSPVGMEENMKSDFRLITATNESLGEISKFMRRDFIARITDVTLKVPRLKDRREDIELLAELFKTQILQEENLIYRDFTERSIQLLKGYDWPGNVRELRNVVRRAVINSRENEQNKIEPEHIVFDDFAQGNFIKNTDVINNELTQLDHIDNFSREKTIMLLKIFKKLAIAHNGNLTKIQNNMFDNHGEKQAGRASEFLLTNFTGRYGFRGIDKDEEALQILRDILMVFKTNTKTKGFFINIAKILNKNGIIIELE